MGRTGVQYSAAAITDQGLKRTSNEDRFGFSAEDGVYVVCDGMGGAAAGEVASSVAVDEVLKSLTGRDPAVDPAEAAAAAIRAANESIYRRAQRNPRLSGMGTTLVAMLTEGPKVWVANVGDSRCYRLRNGKLTQVTVDHSLVDEQVRLGRLTPEQALISPYKNVITRALGTEKEVAADIFALEAEAGDLFLLCSDGLTRELTDARIEAMLDEEATLEEHCARLVAAAKKSGGNDNITCILARAAA